MLSTRQMSVSCAEVEFISSPPKARSPCLQRARCVTRTFAAEQVCGGCVLCVTRTSVAPCTHVGGTAVEVPAGIKFAFAGRPNRTATHVGGAPPCSARTCLLRSRRRRSARSSYCTLFNNRCVLSACSCVSQNTHRRRASAVRFSAFRLPNPTQTRRREVHGGLWPRLNVVQHMVVRHTRDYWFGA